MISQLDRHLLRPHRFDEVQEIVVHVIQKDRDQREEVLHGEVREGDADHQLERERK